MINIFSIFKKNILTEEEKNLIRQICLFYESNKELFSKDINSQEEKRNIIKNIYHKLDFLSLPQLSSGDEIYLTNMPKIYRGISALNSDLLNTYLNEFINGEPFYGGRASIYGQGIYTVIGNDSNVANKYASDGGINSCGVVIESTLKSDSKIIKSSEIENLRQFLFKNLRKMYGNEIENYLFVLQDDGALSAVLGYDAIYVEQKKYMVVLNRSKMIVNNNILKNNKTI